MANSLFADFFSLDVDKLFQDDTEYFASEKETYHLESDDDGHWYVISDGLEDDFHTWVKDTTECNDSEFDFEDCRISGGPQSIHFATFWEI